MIVLRILLRLANRAVNHIAAHKTSSAIVALLLIALAFVSTAKFNEPGGVQASVNNSYSGAASVTATGQPAATVSYFQGQQNFDSQLIWSSLSPELISEAELAGATINDLQDQLDQAREFGRTVEDVAYIGGYKLRDGGSMQFYVAAVKTTSSSDEVDEIFYVFTLDKEGKITSIE